MLGKPCCPLPSLILSQTGVFILFPCSPQPPVHSGCGVGGGEGAGGSVLDKAWEGRGPSIYSPLQRELGQLRAPRSLASDRMIPGPTR